jgi:hypothetical protein
MIVCDEMLCDVMLCDVVICLKVSLSEESMIFIAD